MLVFYNFSRYFSLFLVISRYFNHLCIIHAAKKTRSFLSKNKRIKQTRKKPRKCRGKSRKNIKRSPKSPILVFKRAKTHFAFFEDLLIIFRINPQLFSPISPNKITKRSSENAILVKKDGICDFGGSFDNFPGFSIKNIYFSRRCYKNILENRIFCFHYRHISLFGGSFYKFFDFFISMFYEKNEQMTC